MEIHVLDDVLARLRAARDQQDRVLPALRQVRGGLLQRVGDRRMARGPQETQRARQVVPLVARDGHEQRRVRAVLLLVAAWGDADNMFAALERGFAVRDPGLVYIQSNWRFNPYHDDPRYDDLLRRMGLR